MALDAFNSEEIKRISQASFELGRLHGQEDLLTQYRRCGTLSGLSEIDFTAKEQEWMSEINGGIYKFNFISIGGVYFVELECNYRVQEWVENSIPDNVFINQTQPSIITVPSQST